MVSSDGRNQQRLHRDGRVKSAAAHFSIRSRSSPQGQRSEGSRERERVDLRDRTRTSQFAHAHRHRGGNGREFCLFPIVRMSEILNFGFQKSVTPFRSMTKKE